MTQADRRRRSDLPPPNRATRRQARERALALLYEAEAKDVAPGAVLAELPAPPPTFCVELVNGVAEYQPELDRFLDRYAQDWSVERMPALDRNLLRMSVFELLHRPEVPTAAVISEAVDLARDYSTDESSRFVNGMLSRIARDVRGDTSESS